MSGIQELRDADASHEEIKEYINGKLEEWGIEQPEPPGRMCGFQRGFGRRKGKFGNDTG